MCGKGMGVVRGREGGREGGREDEERICFGETNGMPLPHRL